MQFSLLAQQISVELEDASVSAGDITNCLRSFCLINADEPRQVIGLANLLHEYFLAIQQTLPKYDINWI